jgi:heptosyltransferase-2
MLGHPDVDKLIAIGPEDLQLSGNLTAFAKAIRKSNYDIVIDAYGKIGSAMLAKFSGAEESIGYKKSYLNLFYKYTVPQKSPTSLTKGEALGSRLNLLLPLFEPSGEFVPRIYLSEIEKRTARETLSTHALQLNEPLTMISILGSSHDKSLPATYMAEVMDKIAKEGAQMLLNFAPHQFEEALAIVSLCKPVTKKKVFQDLYEPDLRKSLAIMGQMDGVIGNEGGAINMAKALGVPTFTLFSPWIRKEVWNINEGRNHVAVHLIDYHPDKYKGKIPKDVKDQTQELYQLFKPQLFKNRLKDFIHMIAKSS